MERARKGFAAILAVFLISSVLSAGVAVAGPYGSRGRLFHSPMARLMERLDLSDAQKTTLAGILKQNEANARSIVAGLANARAQLTKDILSGGGSSVIASDSSNVATYAVQADQLRAQIMAQMIPVLSAAQKTKLQKLHDQIGSNVDAAVQIGFAHLDNWIADHQ